MALTEFQRDVCRLLAQNRIAAGDFAGLSTFPRHRGGIGGHVAAGPLLADLLERIVIATKGAEPQALPRALAQSCLISADMAHAVHPNYADQHEPQHRPLVGSGPVLKSNVNQSYASDARTAGFFELLCQRAGVTPQHFVSRSDLACGSTIGPISAARVGVPTVDVGNPMLSMHSCREMAGTADVQPMIDVLRSFFDA